MMSEQKTKVGLVTAWGECGMGYLAKNWVYTFEKYPNKISYQVYSRALPWLTPFRWTGENVVQGPESMDIDHSHFWNWIETFKPDVLLFQDQNIYGCSEMKRETQRLRELGIKLINYPDWIHTGDIEKYRGLYDVNLSHVKRNYTWFIKAKLENPMLITWGVIINHFPFKERKVNKKVRFYINIGTGTKRKGYTSIPRSINKMEGGLYKGKNVNQTLDYEFIASSIDGSEKRVDKSFLKFFIKHPKCNIIFKTADNTNGGLYNLGDVYVYPSRREGVGLTITEAMCCGMPVVTSNYPTMNEWIDDNVDGRLIKIRKIKKSTMPTGKVWIDENHMGQIMMDYINNPAKVTEHSINARKKIETDFNWDDRDTEILKLVES